jgi:hypothetical protein
MPTWLLGIVALLKVAIDVAHEQVRAEGFIFATI